MSGKKTTGSKSAALGSKAVGLLPPPGPSLFQKTEDAQQTLPNDTASVQTEDRMCRKNCSLPYSLFKKLKYYAFEHGVTENSVMVEAIQNHLADWDKH